VFLSGLSLRNRFSVSGLGGGRYEKGEGRREKERGVNSSER